MDFDLGNPLTLFLFAGVLVTGFLLLFALLIRVTHGLFFSRPPERFLQDQTDPRYEAERQAGQAFSRWVLHYLPPFFFAFLLLSLLLL